MVRREFTSSARNYLESWRSLQTPNFWGIYDPRMNPFKIEEEITAAFTPHASASHPGICAGDIHLRPLKESEMGDFPATRFLNNINLSHKNTCVRIPLPLGLFYSENPTDVLKGTSKGVYVSKFIPGENLQKLLFKVDSSDLKFVVSGLAHSLHEHARGREVFPMDFAPRDIVLEGDWVNGVKKEVYMVDNEHVNYASCLTPEELKLKQIKQFDRDWEHAPNFEVLKEIFRRGLR